MPLSEFFAIIIGSTAECAVMSFYLNNVCTPRFNKIAYFIAESLLGITVTLIFFNNYEEAGFLRSIVNFIGISSPAMLMNKDKTWYKLLCISLLYVGNIIISMVVLFAYQLLGLDIGGFYSVGGIDHWISRSVITVGQMLIALLIMHILKRRINRSISIVYYFAGAVTMHYFILLYMIHLSASYGMDTVHLVMIFLSVSLVSAVFISLAFRATKKLHRQEIKEAQKEEQYKYLTEQYELIQKNHLEFRKLRHDFKDHMLVIYTLTKNNETEKLSAYVSKIRDDISSLDDHAFCKNTALNIIAASKYRLARDNGINANIMIRDTDEVAADEVYLCSLMSNILQNAAENTPPNGSIDFRMFVKAGNLVITCKNDTYADSVSLETSKPDRERHGYGLRIIDDIVKLVNGNCIREQRDSVFSTMINIPLGEHV